MNLQNSHVIKWYSWRIWCAKQAGRLMLQTFLVEWHNEELALAVMRSSEVTT